MRIFVSRSWALSDDILGADFEVDATDFVGVGADTGKAEDVEMARPKATAARERMAMRILKTIEFMVLFVKLERIFCDR
jgi:hypothetical protein